MIAPGFAEFEGQMWMWLMAMIRPSAAMVVAPIFGAANVPVQVRILLAFMIGMVATSSVSFDLPTETAITLGNSLFVLGEVITGLAIGFALQLGYSSVLIAGETISNAMGLGFASMSDPQTGQSTPVIGQFLTIFATLLLLAIDGHLMLIAIIVKSYAALPPGFAMMGPEMLYSMVQFGGTLFSMGLLIALPVGGALILVQVMMGFLARTAPALNLFAVGIPVTITFGLVALAATAPILADAVIEALGMGLDQATLVAGGV
ncbi:flagellar biosynthetic protein FliR [Parasphingorhabdus flavimaris]|uniref:Flagellar biosynthetic protein FliR n=1 Tax=Parasphingorhabdus flavimaris TaxID=266812 RepID=A0ABX2MZM8_9SPHN|nr:flagellar biosynthetic protein FliR [Parasphingorhabdus flavimaris]NVD26884.1 flagellar biosynthetic protein FliR [Parasphingorhabdus flavimaris]|tara:strand:+ start:23683 stop:24465 length:783 start_codon:yes stop_codon:yes gene_type:complete